MPDLAAWLVTRSAERSKCDPPSRAEGGHPGPSAAARPRASFRCRYSVSPRPTAVETLGRLERVSTLWALVRSLLLSPAFELIRHALISIEASQGSGPRRTA